MAATGYQLTDAQLMMTLSTYAYAQEDSNSFCQIFAAISNYLNSPVLADISGNSWELIWLGITGDSENLMYVAQSTFDSNTIALAIRGTNPEDWDDLYEDADVFLTSTFPYLIPNGDDNIVTSNGSQIGLRDLLGMPGYTDSNQTSSSITIETFLQNLFGTGMNQQHPVRMYITGHSLGGALASVFSSWVIYSSDSLKLSYFPSTNLLTYTFASPSIGNQDYVDYYNSPPANSTLSFQGYNVYNALDLVPCFCSNLNGILNNGWPWGYGGEACVEPGIIAVQTLLDIAQTPAYVQVGNLIQLPLNSYFTTPPDWNGGNIEFITGVNDWLYNNHVCNTYLNLLGAPIVSDTSSKMISYKAKKQ